MVNNNVNIGDLVMAYDLANRQQYGVYLGMTATGMWSIPLFGKSGTIQHCNIMLASGELLYIPIHWSEPEVITKQ
jgi:hypothetical protein